MTKINFTTITKKILADTITPVSIYLKIRDIFSSSILLESSDYHGNQNSLSFICMKPVSCFVLKDNILTINLPEKKNLVKELQLNDSVEEELIRYLKYFKSTNNDVKYNGIFGYNAFDSVQYFEKVNIEKNSLTDIPDMYYCFYKFIIVINHFTNELTIIENILENEDSSIDYIENLINTKNYGTYKFYITDDEKSTLTDLEYKKMVARGKEHCYRGDVFQIVLSRRFSQNYQGDDFNVYRALRSINPSPYLFYFDFGSFRIFGSSPEAQIEIKNNKASIYPIAGTFKRTGNDEHDKEQASKLAADPKENAEHVMLVDLARNDLSRQTKNVKVEKYREVQFYSHVIHLVSKVTGDLENTENSVKILTSSFPAGTLSGAPKVRAMQLISTIEPENRAYYGGSIGMINLSGDINQAIMIRSFLSKDNILYYQAGAGIVSESVEDNELQEVNNKLGALRKAIIHATQI